MYCYYYFYYFYYYYYYWIALYRIAGRIKKSLSVGSLIYKKDSPENPGDLIVVILW